MLPHRSLEMARKKSSQSDEIAEEPPRTPAEASIEELNEKIAAAEKKLQELGIEKDIWVKKPIDVDPSFHFFFTKLKGPDGQLMLKQHAGATVRLLDAPPYLKRGAIKHLDELVDVISSEHPPPTKKKKPKSGNKKPKK